MVDLNEGKHINTSFDSNWEPKDMHKINDGHFSGPIHISKIGRHRCRLSADLTRT